MDQASPFGSDEKDKFQQQIFISTFSMLAKLTNVDGSIDKAEIIAVDRFMKTVLNLDPERRQYAIKIFNEARRSSMSFREYAVQYRNLLKDKPRMLEWMVDVLLRISMADEVFSGTEEALLKTACEVFNISEQRFEQLRARHVKDQPVLNYQLFGCTAESSNDEVLERYRKMIAEYNPQRIKELGLPDDFIKLAEEKHAAIESAFQQIKSARGL
jgi:DnaJ like chaperone protein